MATETKGDVLMTPVDIDDRFIYLLNEYIKSYDNSVYLELKNIILNNAYDFRGQKKREWVGRIEQFKKYRELGVLNKLINQYKSGNYKISALIEKKIKNMSSDIFYSLFTDYSSLVREYLNLKEKNERGKKILQDFPSMDPNAGLTFPYSEFYNNNLRLLQRDKNKIKPYYTRKHSWYHNNCSFIALHDMGYLEYMTKKKMEKFIRDNVGTDYTLSDNIIIQIVSYLHNQMRPNDTLFIINIPVSEIKKFFMNNLKEGFYTFFSFATSGGKDGHIVTVTKQDGMLWVMDRHKNGSSGILELLTFYLSPIQKNIHEIVIYAYQPSGTYFNLLDMDYSPKRTKK